MKDENKMDDHHQRSTDYATSWVVTLLNDWLEAVLDCCVDGGQPECDVTLLDVGLITDLLLPGPEPGDVAGVTLLLAPEVALQPRPPLQPLMPGVLPQYAQPPQHRVPGGRREVEAAPDLLQPPVTQQPRRPRLSLDSDQDHHQQAQYLATETVTSEQRVQEVGYLL